MNGQTVPPGDKADDLLTGHRRTATGHIDQAVVDPLNNHTAAAAAGFAGPLRRFCRLGRLLRLAPVAVIFVLDTGHHTADDQPAIAHGGVEILHGSAVLALGDPLQKGVVLLAVQADKVSPQLSIHLSLALDDVLVPPLFLEPGANFGPGFAGGHHFQPVSGRGLCPADCW